MASSIFWHVSGQTQDHCLESVVKTPFQLTGDWEIGVQAATFPFETLSYSNLNSGIYINDVRVDFKYPENTEEISNPWDFWESFKFARLSTGAAISTVFKSFFDEDHFSIRPRSSAYRMTLTGRICQILGFRELKVEIRYRTEVVRSVSGSRYRFQLAPIWVKAENRFSGPPRIRHLYVYCDIIEPTLVGSQEVHLLMHAEVAASGGFQPNAIRYVPVKNNIISSIRLQVFDGLGYPVAFLSGKLSFSLHFRRRQFQL